MASRFSIDTVFRAKDHFSRTVLGMSRAVNRFSRTAHRQIGMLNRSIAALGSGALRVGKSISTTGVATAAAVGYAAIKLGQSGADFEEAITAVGAVGLQTRDQIADLEAKAKQLGATTKFTATEAANAMEIMARAGFKNKDILQGIDGVLNAAASSGLEIAEVADHVSNVLKGMGRSSADAEAEVKKLGLTGDAAADMIKRLTIDSSSAGRVADVLALASSKTNSTIGTLGESMRNVAATARQLNVPLEDTVAAVALLQDVGLDASVAGSSLNTMLTKMAKPTADVAAKMKKFGVTFKDARGNMLPLEQVLQNLSKASDKAGGTFDKVAFLADLVGLRGQKAAGNLATLFDTGRTSELAAQLREAAGSAQKMADLRLNNLKGDITLLGSAFDALKTSIYETKSGPLRGLVQGAKEWLDLNSGSITSSFTVWFERLSPLVDIFGKTFKETFDMISKGFDDLVGSPGWSGVEDMLPELIKNLAKLAAFAAAVVITFAGVAAGLTLVASALFSGVQGALKGVTDTFGRIIFAITDWWENIKAIFNSEGLSLSEKALAIGKQIITGLFNGITAAASLPVDALKDIAGKALAAIKKALGIASPSKPAAESGNYVGQGLANGILNSIGLVKAAVAKMSAAVSFDAGSVGTFGAFKPPRMMSSEGLGVDSGLQTEAQMVTPQERVAKQITEKTTTEKVELTINDQTGAAKVTKAPKGKNVNLKLAPSGAF